MNLDSFNAGKKEIAEEENINGYVAIRYSTGILQPVLGKARVEAGGVPVTPAPPPIALSFSQLVVFTFSYEVTIYSLLRLFLSWMQ